VHGVSTLDAAEEAMGGNTADLPVEPSGDEGEFTPDYMAQFIWRRHDSIPSLCM
jgi:hypothetical protein